MVEGLAVNWEGAVSIELDDEQMDMRTIIYIKIYSLTEKFLVAPNDESGHLTDGQSQTIKVKQAAKKVRGIRKKRKILPPNVFFDFLRTKKEKRRNQKLKASKEKGRKERRKKRVGLPDSKFGGQKDGHGRKKRTFAACLFQSFLLAFTLDLLACLCFQTACLLFLCFQTACFPSYLSCFRTLIIVAFVLQLFALFF